MAEAASDGELAARHLNRICATCTPTLGVPFARRAARSAAKYQSFAPLGSFDAHASITRGNARRTNSVSTPLNKALTAPAPSFAAQCVNSNSDTTLASV